MLTRWDAVSTLDRMFDDVMGSMLGTATSTRTFDPSIDVRASDDEVVFVCPKRVTAKPRKVQIFNGRDSKRLEE